MFFKDGSNEAYEHTGNSVIYEVFSILVWVGLISGTETRKKTSPTQYDLEFPLGGVLKILVPHGKNSKKDPIGPPPPEHGS